MPIRFGDHAVDNRVEIDNGMYDATISKAELVTENGKPKVNDNGKQQVAVFFQINEDTTVRRRYSITFGKNPSNGQPSAFSKMLEAATDVKASDDAQRDLTPEHLVGKRVRIVVEMNERGYPDVLSVMPAPRGNSGSASVKPKPVPVAAGPSDTTEPEEDVIPF